jgi:quinol monooxygenase YgiN
VIIIAATLDFADQDSRDDAVTASAPVQWATRVEEPGCHAYCFAADPSVPTRIQVYELWEDEASLAAHFKHPNYDAMVGVLRSRGITATWNRMYLVAKDEPVYGPNGERREQFFVEPQPAGTE